MGEDVIAEKFALLRTRGSNGVAFTHVVEDTLLGQKAVVKISDKLGLLALEYLKTINLLREQGLPGILVPIEGGILEEENGYYFAFPELREPSLENYLRVGVPLTCDEALGVVDKVLFVLGRLHDAGFCHLFINTRNIFYRARGPVTLKDPALKVEFFHPLLELIAAPDFSYFSPEVMDGREPDAGADIYAAGRLAERLLGEAIDAEASPGADALAYIAEKCRGPGEGDVPITADAIRDRLGKKAFSDARRGTGWDEPGYESEARPEIDDESLDVHDGGDGGLRVEKPSRPRGNPLVRSFLQALAATILMGVLVLGIILAVALRSKPDQTPLVNAAGSSEASEASPGDLQADASDGENSGTPPGEEEKATQASQEETAAAVVLEDNGSSENPPPVAPAPVAPAPQAQPPVETSPAAPVASFSVSPSSGQSPLQVHLDASSSYDPDGRIASFSWSFGGQGQAVFHVFESNVVPTTIWVTLTLTDDGGHRSSTARQITLY